ncbi:MAG: hypothetical protein ACFFB0_11800 [Promethearchaeota archaeon]
MRIDIFKQVLNNFRKFIISESEKGKNLIVYEKKSNPVEYFEELDIQVKLGKYKDIILQEETSLELGGIKKKSFSLIYPFSNSDFSKYIRSDNITLVGPEINEIYEQTIDFGLIILIGCKDSNESNWNSLRQFNFISNGIQGFMIRTIPRKFWCRISEEVIKKFTFEFLGNAILYLYEEKFKNLIESMEIIFINSDPDLIDEAIKITSEITSSINEKWLKKIEEWKKRIDCEYDWGCEICPYQEECYEIKQVLVEREKIEK